LRGGARTGDQARKLSVQRISKRQGRALRSCGRAAGKVSVHELRCRANVGTNYIEMTEWPARIGNLVAVLRMASPVKLAFFEVEREALSSYLGERRRLID